MRASSLPVLLVSVPLLCSASLASAQGTEVRTGAAAIDDNWKTDAPGVRRHIKPADLPAAKMAGKDPEASVAKNAKVVEPPQGAAPKVPDGFAVQVFASGFKQPRTLRVAPNGDIFLSESGTGRVLVFGTAASDAAAGGTAKPQVFAENLDRPYGIVFQPPADPQYIYVAAANQVVRYPYRSGEMKAAGPAEVVVGNIPTKRHWTRDLAISRDGKRLFVAVGSASNLAGDMTTGMTPEKIRQFEKTHGRGATWGPEENRAAVRCACSIRRATKFATTPPGCATARAWRCNPARTTCGAWSTSATTSAPTWCPTTWHAYRKAHSTAGPGRRAARERRCQRHDLPGDAQMNARLRTALGEVRLRLLDLHKALVEAARREYERVHGRQSEPAFLEVLVKDRDFAWLGALTALIARLDEALEEGDPLQEDWIEQVRRLLTPGMAGGDFNRKYEQLTQQLPEIVVAHGEVVRALRAYRPVTSLQSCGPAAA